MFILVPGGIEVNTNDYWKLFLETGAPEIYIMYAKLQKAEEQHVFNCTGDCPQGNRL